MLYNKFLSSVYNKSMSQGSLPISESFILGCIGAIGGIITITFTALRKSRCRVIKCCGCRCDREVLSTEELQMEHNKELALHRHHNSV